MNIKRYTIPTLFWDDHRDRCPVDGDPETARERMATEIRRGVYGRVVLIEGTPEQIEVLRSDAAFYADKDGPDLCPPDLRLAARRTLEKLELPL